MGKWNTESTSLIANPVAPSYQTRLSLHVATYILVAFFLIYTRCIYIYVQPSDYNQPFKRKLCGHN